jgi:hypothetical protein
MMQRDNEFEPAMAFSYLALDIAIPDSKTSLSDLKWFILGSSDFVVESVHQAQKFG